MSTTTRWWTTTSTESREKRFNDYVRLVHTWCLSACLLAVLGDVKWSIATTHDHNATNARLKREKCLIFSFWFSTYFVIYQNTWNFQRKFCCSHSTLAWKGSRFVRWKSWRRAHRRELYVKMQTVLQSGYNYWQNDFLRIAIYSYFIRNESRKMWRTSIMVSMQQNHHRRLSFLFGGRWNVMKTKIAKASKH